MRGYHGTNAADESMLLGSLLDAPIQCSGDLA